MGLDLGAPSERYQVVVHVDAQALPIRISRASPSSRTARAFPRKRLSPVGTIVDDLLRTRAEAGTSVMASWIASAPEGAVAVDGLGVVDP